MTSLMNDSELSPIGKGAIVHLLCIALIAAIANAGNGQVRHPLVFGVALVGFGPFLTAKLSVVLRKKWISVGTSLMTERAANAYRLGYSLMIVGFLLSFA